MPSAAATVATTTTISSLSASPTTMLMTISIINMRWRPPRLWLEDHERQIAVFSDILPKQVFDARLQQLNRLVRAQCPSSHTEYYVFVFIITCIACSAGFSLAARSADISMWYPLILLLVPAALSFWTSRRRATLVLRIKQFEQALKQTLREFNKKDRIRWSFRRPTAGDPLPTEFRTARLCLIIELGRAEEELPSYQAAVTDAASSIYYPRGLPPPSYSEVNMQELQQNRQHQHQQSSSLASSSRLDGSTLTFPATCSSQTSLIPTVPEPVMVRHQREPVAAAAPAAAPGRTTPS
ncbi:hypothetical protein BDB00DRAFT_877670 [Zychaea mexicana]|uniref:uncharacterized protein n=1 Tax=Zychaea mexicana TaxID=64656 RepID=UPI0022FF3455|nr:uncharacterized protein BDB00DRAFT_877670 [Zychaea mexicana]KAI9488199.1 hypothetical protein BDB00DRAFT_877670 [Zychaea mexicana]